MAALFTSDASAGKRPILLLLALEREREVAALADIADTIDLVAPCRANAEAAALVLPDRRVACHGVVGAPTPLATSAHTAQIGDDRHLVVDRKSVV